ncbi:hypothetical protein [Streptomyces sp. HUAS TT20]|uniref:hypothetical protein n=1 Tax=Streptomyces sp. HUAS TT20 TaxID=3447509 RepID=UPI0021D7DAC1|nr:hypothetical protein [Streptomyces sp. HUAS 15-9]UXY26624.1 hypothetical protein N8I87_08565 [Streptomyces sp. HUAS 15-9]
MSWTRGFRATLAVCVLLLTGTTGCGTGEAHEREDGDSPSPVGRVLGETDGQGRHYREVGKKGAPDVDVEVAPDAAGNWDVRLTVRNFRFSPAGTKAEPTAGRGLAYLFVDGGLVTRLRSPEYRLAPRLVPHGTHHVTARLYADDDTVWAVRGKPVESTADITASGAETETGATPATSGATGATAR